MSAEIGLGVGITIGVVGLLSVATLLFFKFCRGTADDAAPSPQAAPSSNSLQNVSFAAPIHSNRVQLSNSSSHADEYGHGPLSVGAADQYADVPRESHVAGNIYRDVPVVVTDNAPVVMTAGYRPLPNQALRADGGYVPLTKEAAIASPQIRAVQAIGGGGVVSGRQELSASKSEALALYGDVPSEAATLVLSNNNNNNNNTAVARTRTGTVAPAFL